MIIIASDFDGTLNHHGISEADKNAINKFRAEGNKFGIVTGRDLEQLLQLSARRKAVFQLVTL